MLCIKTLFYAYKTMLSYCLKCKRHLESINFQKLEAEGCFFTK